jgi:hypothetical protein
MSIKCPNTWRFERDNQYDLRFSRQWLWRMASSGTLRRVALARADVSEELTVSIIRVTRIGEIGATLVVTIIRHFFAAWVSC